MTSPIRYHADENISTAVVEGLRRRGIAVSSTSESGLIGASVLAQLEFARANNSVLVTKDSDFLRIHATGQPHSGIAYFQQNATSGEIIRMLVLLYDLVTAEEIAGRVEYC